MPMVVTSNRPDDARRVSFILLLADMHFGPAPLAEAPLPVLAPQRISSVLRVAEPLGRYFRTKCGTQDGNMTQRLAPYLRSEITESGGAGLELCLLLGDQVTFPDPDAFSYVAEYVTQLRFVPRISVGELTCDGLGLTHDRVLAVPGNHDKLLRRDLDEYHAGFSIPIGLPPLPREQSCRFVSRTIGDWEFLFLLVDANEYARGDNQVDDSPFEFRRHLAAGRVSNALVQNVRDGLQALAAGHVVGDAELQDYRSATKVLVLHYAASQWAVSGFSLNLDELLLPHVCRQIDRLLDAVSGHVDLVVHGHLHREKIYRRRGVPVISVPTLCQLGDQEHGFFLLEAEDTGTRRTLRARYHAWDETSFRPQALPTISILCRTLAQAATVV